jgi:hypothetical protein
MSAAPILDASAAGSPAERRIEIVEPLEAVGPIQRVPLDRSICRAERCTSQR